MAANFDALQQIIPEAIKEYHALKARARALEAVVKEKEGQLEAKERQLEALADDKAAAQEEANRYRDWSETLGTLLRREQRRVEDERRKRFAADAEALRRDQAVDAIIQQSREDCQREVQQVRDECANQIAEVQAQLQEVLANSRDLYDRNRSLELRLETSEAPPLCPCGRISYTVECPCGRRLAARSWRYEA